MGFAGSWWSHEDGSFFFLNEIEVKEAHDLGFVNGFRKGEIKSVNGFDNREPGLGNPGFDEPLLTGGDLLGGKEIKDIQDRKILFLRFVQGFLQDIIIVILLVKVGIVDGEISFLNPGGTNKIRINL